MTKTVDAPLPEALGSPVDCPVMAQAPARDGLRVVPCDLKTANEFVRKLHRHSRPAVGHRFSVGVADAAGVLRGVAIIGRLLDLLMAPLKN